MQLRPALRTLTMCASISISAQAFAGVDLQSFEVIAGGARVSPLVFTTVGAQGAPGLEAGPGATVAWPVAANQRLLNTLPASIQINFPDRPLVTLSRISSERRGGNRLFWLGTGGDCDGIFRIGFTGFKGTISCATGQYGIDHALGTNSLRLTRYDNSGTGINSEPAPGLPVVSMPVTPDTAVGALVDQTVDVLVLFNGSMTSVNIYDTAQDIVDQIRSAMLLSKNPTDTLPPADVRLAGTARISRTVPNDPAGDLGALPNDPEVLALRNYWAADAVIYITTGTGPVQGIAYVPQDDGAPPPGASFAPLAFAVSLGAYATNPGDYVAAHEFAHTFGANHNPDHLPLNDTPVRPYAFGHWAKQPGEDVPVGYRTIMSYLQECYAVVQPCSRILRYSNPNVIYGGWFHTGIANQRDNARLIKDIAPTEALYRHGVGRIFADGFQ